MMNLSPCGRTGAEVVAPGDQVFPQRLVVVDLAVKNHPQCAVFVGDRLMPGAQVDNAQPSHAEGASFLDMEALVVRTTVPDPVAHAFDEFRSGLPVAADISRNPAHS